VGKPIKQANIYTALKSTNESRAHYVPVWLPLTTSGLETERAYSEKKR